MSVNDLDKQGKKKKYIPANVWKPGQSGTPKGRPLKGHSLTESLQEAMDSQPDIKKALIAKTIELAIKSNDLNAIKLIWQYLDGMPRQQIDNKIDLTPYDIKDGNALGKLLGTAGFVPALGSRDKRKE